MDYTLYSYDFSHMKWVFERWFHSYENDYKLPEHYKEEFFEVTMILSNCLPKVKNPILFEIDDILYPESIFYQENSENDNIECKDSCDPRIVKFLESTIGSIYFRAYRDRLDYEADFFVDNTVLRFIKHIHVDTYHLRSALQFLLNSKDVKDVCRGLKMWKIILEGELKDKFLDREFYCTILSLKDIAEPTDPEYKRISGFISELVGVCCNLVGDDKRYIFPEDKEEKPKKVIIQGLHCLISNAYLPNYYLEYIYKAFSPIPEDSSEKKRKYLKCILRAITSCPMRLSVDDAITVIVDYLLDNIRGALSHCFNEEMILIDVKHGLEIKPYLKEVDFLVDWSEFYADEYDNKNDETDYTFEKFFYYDKVMKSLHLLTIFYTAFAECKNLCVGEFNREDYTKAFRGKNDLMENVSYYLKNKKMRVPWYVKKAMMMCPFLLFPLEHKGLVIDLIKLQREDEDVPKMSEELCKKIKEMEAFKKYT